jgi:hypothetical protein
MKRKIITRQKLPWATLVVLDLSELSAKLHITKIDINATAFTPSQACLDSKHAGAQNGHSDTAILEL